MGRTNNRFGGRRAPFGERTGRALGRCRQSLAVERLCASLPSLQRCPPYRWGAGARLRAQRAEAYARHKRLTPVRAEDRPLVVSQTGGPLEKSSYDSAWQRLIALAIREGVHYGGGSLHDARHQASRHYRHTRQEFQRTQIQGDAGPRQLRGWYGRPFTHAAIVRRIVRSQ